MKNITLIDMWEGGHPENTCGYLIEAEKLTLVETGPGPSGERILDIIKEKGFRPADLKYVILTHIHLDHAGAAGYLLRNCPAAQLIVHPSGARHMADPSKLIAGARTAFEDFDTRFHQIFPVPEERIIAIADQSTLDLGDRQLTFYHGRGHANHHLTIMDSLTNGLFSGDLLGIFAPEFGAYNIEYSLFSSPPNQFHPEAYAQSLEMVRSLHPDTIYFSHYGTKTGLTDYYLDLCFKNLNAYCEIAQDVCSNESPTWQEIDRRIASMVKEAIVKMGWPKERDLPAFIKSNIALNAKGLFDWWQKNH